MTANANQKASNRHPHFDDGIVVWDDKYSGRYSPPDKGYREQFNRQWRMALEENSDLYDNPSVSVEDDAIADRVYEWTHKHPLGLRRLSDSSMGARRLDRPVDLGLIRGKRCLDIGCGVGRWTRAMLSMGAESVTAIDQSASALTSVARFTDNVCCVDVMALPEEKPEWIGSFDFVNMWGVAMCTHDPCVAFRNAARMVRPGGALFVMVYAEEGHHNSQVVRHQRKVFHKLADVEERLRYMDHVHSREWDKTYPLSVNLRNVAIRAWHWMKRKETHKSKVGVLDMLSPSYNWVIPRDVLLGWYAKCGFAHAEVLGTGKEHVAYHALGTGKIDVDADA